MGAYRYCEECSHGLNEPTPREDLGDGQECPVCGCNQSRCHSKADWIERLYDEIEELKEEIKNIKIKVRKNSVF